MTRRPSLLYISPVVPQLSGNGLAMRAGVVLELLAGHYRVHLLVIPLYLPGYVPIPENFARLCDALAIVPVDDAVVMLHDPASYTRQRRFFRRGSARDDRPRLPFRDARFDVVHVFRLAATPFAVPYLDSRTANVPGKHLDLDDIDSETRGAIAALQRQNGDVDLALAEEEDARTSLLQEREAFEIFDRIYVCSEADRATVASRYAGDVRILPNAIRLPSDAGPPARDDPFTFLFVGTLGYYPNEDAILFFCREILPILRREATRPFRLTIAGTGTAPAVVEMAREPEVNLVGAVPDIGEAYRDADAVVVPIRAGGGTRIKVLEAFGYRRPVVTTPVGAAGIAVRDGEHVLLAAGARDFATACLRIMDDDDLAARLAGNAYALVSREYALEAGTSAGAVLPPRRDAR